MDGQQPMSGGVTTLDVLVQRGIGFEVTAEVTQSSKSSRRRGFHELGVHQVWFMASRSRMPQIPEAHRATLPEVPK